MQGENILPLMKGGERELLQGTERLREVNDEQKRRDLGVHFVAFGGLRYNREKVIELILEKSMIPIEQLKESSFYQMILEEGEKKGEKKGIEKGKIESATEILLELVEQRFPQLNVTTEINRIKDPETLRKLCVELFNIKSSRALQKRIAELSRPKK